MKSPPGKVIELSNAIVRAEVAPDDADPEQLAAAERILGTLQDNLTPLIGGTGFHALLERAFQRAGAERSFAGGAREPGSIPNATRELRAGMEGLHSRDVHGALIRVIAELVALLARLIGADITVRLVHRTWPDTVPWLTAAHLEDGDG